MKKYFLALALLFVLVSSLSGVAYADEIGKCFLYLNPQNYQLALQAGENAVKLYPDSARAHGCLGGAYYYLGDFNSSVEELKTAERLTSDEKILSGIYGFLGEDYENLGNFNTALLYYSRALKIHTDLNDTETESIDLDNIAGIYMYMGNYDKALEYYNKSLQLTSNPSAIATIYSYIGLVYLIKGDNNKAIEYAKNTIQIDQENGNYKGIVRDMIDITLPYISLGNFSEAKYYLTQGLDMAKKLGEKEWEAIAYAVFGQLYSAQNQETLAKEYFTKSYNLYKSIGNNSEAQRIYKTYLKTYLRQ